VRVTGLQALACEDVPRIEQHLFRAHRTLSPSN
jgi:hypothetical protein